MVKKAMLHDLTPSATSSSIHNNGRGDEQLRKTLTSNFPNRLMTACLRVMTLLLPTKQNQQLIWWQPQHWFEQLKRQVHHMPEKYNSGEPFMSVISWDSGSARQQPLPLTNPSVRVQRNSIE